MGTTAALFETPAQKPSVGPYHVNVTLKTFTVRETDPSRWNTAAALRSSEDVAKFARAIYAELDADQEHFVLLALNNKNRFIGYKVISTGSMTASLVHPRECYTAALHLNAAALVFVHNHPSGDPAPSPDDIDITRRLKEVGDVIGMRVLDHVVIGHDRFFSFNDKGML